MNLEIDADLSEEEKTYLMLDIARINGAQTAAFQRRSGGDDNPYQTPIYRWAWWEGFMSGAWVGDEELEGC